MISILLKGIVLGFLIAAPVGPVGVLCIRRTFAHGWIAGILAGLGAALADAIFGIIAAFGLKTVSDVLLANQEFLRLGGGTFLIVMGIRTMLQRGPVTKEVKERPGLFGGFKAAFLLTITNPVTLLAFMAIHAASDNVAANLSLATAGVLVGGVLLGALLWWFLLTATAGIFRNVINAENLTIVNRVAGVLLVGFGIFLLVSLVV